MVHPPCIGYSVVFSREADKDLHKLEKKTITKVLEKIRDLTSDRSSHLNIKKLKLKSQLYRLKFGDYRVVYCIKQKEIIVQIVAVGHRKNVYDILSRRVE